MEKKNIICGPCMQNNKQIILLGNEGKRKDFFLKAGLELNRPILFFPMYSKDIFNLENPEDYIIKIDPPLHSNHDYSDLNAEINKFSFYLELLGKTNFHFLNSPQAIIECMNKKIMKNILEKNKIKMPETIDLKSYDLDSLFTKLKSKAINNVFIKPKLGSGGVGILALKCNFKKNDFILFSSLLELDGVFCNTKKLRIIKDKQRIFKLLNRILEDDPLIERWIEKKRFDRKPFDLRVLVNFNKVECIIPRASSGPITNLHLNNQALDLNSLNIDMDTLAKVESMAISAVAAFPKLNYAGVDLLLDKNNNIYIIEVNAQGDLIYKDIYGDNQIYKRQIERM